MKLARREFLWAGIGGVSAIMAKPGLGHAFDQTSARAECDDETLPPPRMVMTWGSNGTAEGQFDIPIAIVISPQDEILVTDFRQTNAEAKGRLQRFDTSGKLLGSFEVEPMPGGLALNKDGLLFATHMMRHKVVVYDQAGKPIREFGKQGKAPGEFEQPGGIAFGPDGSIYVADQVNHRIQRLTPEGEPISAWGKYGVLPGEFGGNSIAHSRGGGPHFLAFNSQGDVYTTEGSVGRVQRFKSDGTFILAFGDNEVGPGHFGGGKSLQGPIGIAVDSKDQIWVTSTNHRVQQFSTDGKYLRGLGGEGSEPGQFRIPHGLAFDSQGFLYVLDSRNSRIQKLEV